MTVAPEVQVESVRHSEEIRRVTDIHGDEAHTERGGE